jgi:hypothetical protein
MIGVLSVQVATKYYREDESDRCSLQLYFEFMSTYPVNYGVAHAEASFEGRPARVA